MRKYLSKKIVGGLLLIILGLAICAFTKAKSLNDDTMINVSVNLSEAIEALADCFIDDRR